jgi:preprotein translocase subunit SecG
VGSGTSTTLVVVGGTVSLAIAFLVMVTGTPIAELQQLFLGTSGVGTPPWIGSFIQSIRSVYLLSTVFLVLAIIPSVMRGKATNTNRP